MIITIFIRISVGPFLNQYLPFSLQVSIFPPWASAAVEDLRAPSPGSPEQDSRQEGGVPPLLPGTPVPSSCPSAVGDLPPPHSPGSAHPELNGRQGGGLVYPPSCQGPSVLTRQDKRKWEEEEGSPTTAVGDLPPHHSPGSTHPELNGRQGGGLVYPPPCQGPSVQARQDKRKWEEEGSQVFEELGRVVSMGAQLQSEYTAVLQLPMSPKRMKVVMDKLDSLGQRKRLLNGRVVAFSKKKEELRKEEKTTCIHCRASLNSERSRYCGIQYTTLYTVHCTLYTVHCTLYAVHCTLYTVHYTMDIVHCTLYNVCCTRHSVQITLSNTQYALHTAHYRLCSVTT